MNANAEIIELKERLIETKNYLRIAKLKMKALEDKGDKFARCDRIVSHLQKKQNWTLQKQSPTSDLEV